ncbi:MAG: DNA repair protein RecN, partial [Microbacteriaceae bacterium]|nr:DNA repair protein RecN [Microbacteriaceae bacterium]
MIEQLRIRDLGVIVDTTLDLGPGFTAITGETGAGKTMVVTALGLLMGERSDAGAVRRGADAARVGGLIRTDDTEIAALVDELGGDLDDGDLTLTRTVSVEGRSRASIGGSAAPVGALARLSERLFAVHGQSEQLRLRSTTAQREMLDRFAGQELSEVLADYQRVHGERRDVQSELDELIQAQSERAEEAQRLREQLREIEAVDPQPGEEDELRVRIDRLSNLEELRTATATAMRAISSETDDPYASDATSLIDGALRDIERVSASDPRLEAIAEDLRSLSFATADVSRDIAAYAGDLDQDGPAELAIANERFAELTALLRQYGAGSEAVLAASADMATRLNELDDDSSRIATAHETLQALAAEEDRLATELTSLRSAAALALSDRVTVELRHLALPDATFTVQLTESDVGRTGRDEVRLMLQPHAGAAPRPLAKGASGGELSRVMLALEVVVAETDPVPTFVFDEVDAGVGGAAAIEIGRRLSKLARTSQVIVVTHLAQVAAFATNHVQVVKDSAGGF